MTDTPNPAPLMDTETYSNQSVLWLLIKFKRISLYSLIVL